jgi:hypothetical protein
MARHGIFHESEIERRDSSPGVLEFLHGVRKNGLIAGKVRGHVIHFSCGFLQKVISPNILMTYLFTFSTTYGEKTDGAFHSFHLASSEVYSTHESSPEWGLGNRKSSALFKRDTGHGLGVLVSLA